MKFIVKRGIVRMLNKLGFLMVRCMFILSYVAIVVGFSLWSFVGFLYTSVFMGFPLIIFWAMLVGGAMMLLIKLKRVLILGFLLTQSVIALIKFTIKSLPLKRFDFIDDAPLAPEYVAPIILVGSCLFYILSVYIFVTQLHKMKKNDKRKVLLKNKSVTNFK